MAVEPAAEIFMRREERARHAAPAAAAKAAWTVDLPDFLPL
jgi:hypothetical protein